MRRLKLSPSLPLPLHLYQHIHTTRLLQLIFLQWLPLPHSLLSPAPSLLLRRLLYSVPLHLSPDSQTRLCFPHSIPLAGERSRWSRRVLLLATEMKRSKKQEVVMMRRRVERRLWCYQSLLCLSSSLQPSLEVTKPPTQLSHLKVTTFK